MKEGSVVLTPLAQANEQTKNRPALVLRTMPRFGDLLVCGFSTQLNQEVVGLDELIYVTDADFSLSGLSATSLIRLGFLAVRASAQINGTIGAISSERHQRLLRRLSQYLIEHLSS